MLKGAQIIRAANISRKDLSTLFRRERWMHPRIGSHERPRYSHGHVPSDVLSGSRTND